MKVNGIIKSILICIGISLGFHLVLSLIFTPISNYHGFYVFCLAFWALTNFGILYLGQRIASDSNPNTFSQLVLVSVFIKLFIGIGLIVLYKLEWSPADNYFAIPFIQVYIIFTVYETYALMKIGRGN